MPKLTIHLNGTAENPWHVYGLHRNPFPQIARAEYMAGQIALAELDADPLTSTEDIRARLAGKVSDELVLLCMAQFRFGERVSFQISFEE